MPAETTMMYFQAASMLFGLALEGDEKGADEGRQLDRDPVEPGIVHHRADQGAQREAGEQRVEAGKPPSSPSSRM